MTRSLGIALVLVAGLLVAATNDAPLMEPTAAVTFPERWKPSPGSQWSEKQRQHMTGHTLIKVGPAKVRDKTNDDGVEWEGAFEVSEMADGQLSAFEIVFSKALRRSGEESEDLGLAGVAVNAKGAKKRSWRTAEGKRPKKKARDFLKEQFGRRGGESPLDLLLPPNEVSVGDSWDVDMAKVVEELGRDRFTLDAAQSHARCTLESVLERRGVSYGRIAFDVVIVPSVITDGEFEEARMAVAGAVELPLQTLPGMVLEYELTTRFKGWVKSKGFKATIDMDHHTVGRQERR